MTIRFWRFFIIRKFSRILSAILPTDYVTCRTLLLAGAIRVRSMLITPLIRIRHELPIACGKLREELLDFRDERHDFFYFFGTLPLKNHVFMVKILPE